MQIRFEDLFHACQKCGGEGIVSEAGVKPNSAELDTTTGLDACKACDGHGGVVTPTGEAIRKFVKHLRRHGLV